MISHSIRSTKIFNINNNVCNKLIDNTYSLLAMEGTELPVQNIFKLLGTEFDQECFFKLIARDKCINVSSYYTKK